MLTKLSLLPAVLLAVALIGPPSVISANADDDTEAVGDPLKLRYIITGVRNVQPGTSTYVHCANLNNVTETLRFILRNKLGVLVNTLDFDVQRNNSIEVATSNTDLFDNEQTNLAGATEIDTGFILVSATTSKLVCTSSLVRNDLNDIPLGVSLHMVRVNPRQGWFE